VKGCGVLDIVGWVLAVSADGRSLVIDTHSIAIPPAVEQVPVETPLIAV
jgi:hypothetical protein